MYKIISVSSEVWDNQIKNLWELYRLYDMQDTTPSIKMDPAVDNVWIDPSDIFDYQKEKTLAFSLNNHVFGMLRIQDFSDKSSYLKIAGISNMAVQEKFRNNGIGKKLMEVADLYIKFSGYDVSLLYPSLYATECSFYEKLGYMELNDEFSFNDKKYKAHVKYYCNTPRKGHEFDEELIESIKKIGKF